MKKNKIVTFYRGEQVYSIQSFDESRSPLKPKLLLEYLAEQDLDQFFEIKSDFAPFTKDQFFVAHKPEYVEGFFAGKEPYCSGHDTLGIKWSRQYAETVRYTNASFYHAIRYAIEHPNEISFSPTSGFHHAIPQHGALFCAFSGQVIASIRLYRELGVCGAYIDLDGHYGNSIEDSREFVPDLNEAVPKGWNVNIETEHEEYLKNLKIILQLLKDEFVNKKLHYVVFCHGADSHELDDIGRQLTTEEWIECSKIFYEWVNEVELETGRPLPVSLSLFGGYRRDDFRSVLSLHTIDLVKCLNILCGHNIEYQPQVQPRG
ncbi:hypothetical protein [Candidatus Uabimicrobium amorphum]|uniref:Histone deacetylase n=1 Tax=Uabimicrobium amorphum TaxID=2596890 RepID=A0A5S9IKR9_UABAM|nr:hypothetical protein [Candidatus Uabimicrobium amorphum]BBM83688.1 histone deacetylase [Candidatus Uabimicrobium amorphum]